MKSTAKKTTPYTGGQPTLEQLAEHDAQWRRSRLELAATLHKEKPRKANALHKQATSPISSISTDLRRVLYFVHAHRVEWGDINQLYGLIGELIGTRTLSPWRNGECSYKGDQLHRLARLPLSRIAYAKLTLMKPTRRDIIRAQALDLLTKIAGKRPVPPNTLEKKIAVLGKWLKYFEDGTEQRLVLVDDIRSAVRDLVGKSVPTHMLYPAERKPMDKQMTRDKSLVFKRLVKVIDCCFVAAESLVSLSDTESDYTARRAKNTLQTIIYPEVGQWTQYCILLNVS